MRLINVRTGELQSFTKDIPPYAILSHMWGADNDEVTIQEMLVSPEDRPPRTTSKLGHEKILKSCEIAKSYDISHERILHHHTRCIEHIWIDTCCIDKSSSAELSEAINSMYRYYREVMITAFKPNCVY